MNIKKIAIGCGGFTAILVALVVALGVLVIPDDWEPPKKEDLGDRSGAWVACRRAVLANLKTPSTADFPFGAMKGFKHDGEGNWYIESYVDAQNILGAQVRTAFTCRVEYAGGDQYRLIDLKMGAD